MTRRVLVVDDEPDIRALVRMSLELVGHWEVIVAASAEEAVAVATEEQPDAVLLDVMMPVTDGPATFALLQADPRTRAIPVLLLTARVESGDHDAWLAGGVHGVLAKPFDPLLLPAQVAEALGWSQ